MEQHSKLTGLKLSSIPARKSPLGPDGTEKMNPKYHTLQTDGLWWSFGWCFGWSADLMVFLRAKPKPQIIEALIIAIIPTKPWACRTLYLYSELYCKPWKIYKSTNLENPLITKGPLRVATKAGAPTESGLRTYCSHNSSKKRGRQSTLAIQGEQTFFSPGIPTVRPGYNYTHTTV